MHITSLDISSHALASAIEDTSPAATNATYTRRELLEVSGGLKIFNPASVNAECIIATEVCVYSVLSSILYNTSISSVEHLPEVILADFVPTILGIYHPRLLLVKTPFIEHQHVFQPSWLDEHCHWLPRS
ncbi:uncharacterized protein EDB93DRAFT_1143700 [Suillus bovinus]|uniref:uncharacterized protein n=1 Tax=Suillus bovinus TaxID=48563 RepID=UPI001B85DB25|nr:uncharacterized protein EDB93DRAFT_1143700 [Suillus bovinus]KAG2149109.1 hypothetical protein EDB93DRAFT_1143700 [Suillus bovinus]